MRRKLPDLGSENNVCDKIIQDRDERKKERGKEYFDNRNHIKVMDLRNEESHTETGERKLVVNQLSFNTRVNWKGGNSIEVDDGNGTEKRNVVHLKTMNFDTEEKIQN